MEALTLADVWDLAPCAGPPPRKDGMVKSPFRSEERTGSFSVTLGQTRFVDFGDPTCKGGVWQFVAFCHPDWPKREIARVLVERAGLEWSEGGREMSAKERKEWRARQEAEKTEARERIYRNRRKEEAPPGAVRPEAVREWPGAVRERFEEGLSHLWAHPEKMARQAKKREWPLEWVEWLVGAGQMSFPLQSGFDGGEENARRMVAFPVQFPRMVGGRLDLVTVGYHQKTFWPARGEFPERKGWEFCPNYPRKAWSRFQNAMRDHSGKLGLEEPGTPVIRPYPFLLGNPSVMELLILTEGQWDAAAIYGAMGAFVDVWDTPVVVAGVRGASGDGPMFAALEPWIKRSRPQVWVLADNDRAGARWYRPKTEPGKIPPLTMVDRLRAISSGVKVSLLKRARGGKDFDDYYRAKRPQPEQILQWIKKLELLTR